MAQPVLRSAQAGIEMGIEGLASRAPQDGHGGLRPPSCSRGQRPRTVSSPPQLLKPRVALSPWPLPATCWAQRPRAGGWSLAITASPGRGPPSPLRSDRLDYAGESSLTTLGLGIFALGRAGARGWDTQSGAGGRGGPGSNVTHKTQNPRCLLGQPHGEPHAVWPELYDFVGETIMCPFPPQKQRKQCGTAT